MTSPAWGRHPEQVSNRAARIQNRLKRIIKSGLRTRRRYTELERERETCNRMRRTGT